MTVDSCVEDEQARGIVHSWGRGERGEAAVRVANMVVHDPENPLSRSKLYDLLKEHYLLEGRTANDVRKVLGHANQTLSGQAYSAPR